LVLNERPAEIGEGRPGRDRLDVALAAATAKRPVELDRDVAELGRALVEDQPDSPLARLAADGAEIDARLVTLAAERGDAGAAALLDRAWVAFGALCASLVNALDPEVIVIGGSIAEHHHGPLFDQIAVEMERRAFPILLDKVRIVPAALGADVSLIGSLPIVNDRIDDPAYALGPTPSQQGASIS